MSSPLQNIINFKRTCVLLQEDTPPPLEEAFQGPSLALWVFAWIFLIIGIIILFILIIYTKYGRETSIRLSVITISLVSFFLGFSFHFFLLHFGM